MRCGNWVSLKCVIVSRKCGISENVKEYVISAGPPRSPATKVNYSRLFAPSERWRKIIKKTPGVFHQTKTGWNRACKREQPLSISKVIICNIFSHIKVCTNLFKVVKLKWWWFSPRNMQNIWRVLRFKAVDQIFWQTALSSQHPWG